MSADAVSPTNAMSIIRGTPLSEEPGLGALTIPGYLREVTSRFAGREALVRRTADDVVRWSYDELWERSVEMARALIACGVGKDTRVGVLMTNRPEFLVAVFGTALAGGVSVALNTFSTAPELEHLMKISGVSVLLFERHVAGKDFADVLGDLEPAIRTAGPGRIHAAKFPFLRRLVAVDSGASPVGGAIERWQDFLGQGEAISLALVEAIAATAKPADTGVLFFSSGTTSMPKGIVHSHRAVAIQWWRMPRLFDTKGDVRFWTANGFFWSGNFTLAIGNALSSGGSLVLQSTFQPAEAIELMQMERVTFPLARPHQWARLEAELGYLKADFSSMRYVDQREPPANHPSVNTNWRVPPSFGTTETLAICCSLPASQAWDVPDDCYGMPLPGNILKIVDPVTGVVVGQGQRGELAIKGATLMMGYLGKTPDESFDDEGYYRTGDGGYVDDHGRLFWEGRLSDIVKTGGANVSPIEIDIAIATYPGVKVTQTVGVPDNLLGEMVVACIVPQDDVVLEEGAIRDFLKDKLASYKIPRRILFFREEEVPLTGSGAKIKTGDLRALAAKKLDVAAKGQ